MKKTSADRVPKAIQHLRQLHLEPPSPSSAFAKHLELFKEAKKHHVDVFIDGVLLFTRIANLSPAKRVKYYGSQFSGLHYHDDLTDLWNSSSTEPIAAYHNQLIHLCPPNWDHQLTGDSYFTLIYQGDDLSAALEKLLQGPTVIDCGMFCQLSVWFGIKYMLGNALFNDVFGHSPFYLTQLFYNPITSPTAPHLGNPLYPFFNENALTETNSSVSVTYVPNHRLYPMKHPGGNSSGHNCVVIHNKYTIFDPTKDTTSNLSRHEVESLLLKMFNTTQNDYDAAQLAMYAKQDAHLVHSKFGIHFGELIEKAKLFANLTLKAIETEPSIPTQIIQFNFDRFCTWLEKICHPELPAIDYTPLTADQLVVPHPLAEQIPHENRAKISFSTFIVETPLQKKLLTIAKKFCFDVMSARSVCTVLTGKAGIGKTASAVSCAKELSSRDKKIIWISEVMVRGWAEDKAKSMKELIACRNEIRHLLASNPDAVFLDDDNLIGYSGRVLLEEIYTWYVSTSGKGLFITSNEQVTFKDCYGFKFDLGQQFHFPPFPGYTSPQYINTIVHSGLKGQSMRLTPHLSITDLSDEEKITALVRYHGSGASVGILIDAKTYESQKQTLADVEFVPAFPELLFDDLNRTLKENGTLSSAYNELSPEQREYTQRYPVYKAYCKGRRRYVTDSVEFYGIKNRPFTGTFCKTIAIELDVSLWPPGAEIRIEKECLSQLLRIINYAHDRGGKKVILINKTKFTHNELLNKIKDGIPIREKERTLARIDTLLFSPELLMTDQQQETEEPSSFEFSKPNTTLTTKKNYGYNPMPWTRSQEVSTRPLDDPSSFIPKWKRVGRFQTITQQTTYFPFFFLRPSLLASRLNRLAVRNYLIENRHKSPQLQEAYDKQFGLVLK